jgi:uncharacterized protein YggU (UPF0235/DUF167 family)
VAGGHFRLAKGGVELFVRLTPRAARDEIGDVEATADGRTHLAARVRAVPDKGKANQALERLVADWLDLPRSTVRVHAGGATQRLKTLRIDGDAAAIAAQIEKLSGWAAAD